VGDHGVAVMLAREEFGMRGDLQSDCASVLPLTQALLPFSGLRFMRDPTRGGLAMIAHEIRRATGFGIYMDENAIPVREAVASVCEISVDPRISQEEDGRGGSGPAPALAAWRLPWPTPRDRQLDKQTFLW
jgi:hydrogenase expression/formation protein HypE